MNVIYYGSKKTINGCLLLNDVLLIAVATTKSTEIHAKYQKIWDQYLIYVFFIKHKKKKTVGNYFGCQILFLLFNFFSLISYVIFNHEVR